MPNTPKVLFVAVDGPFFYIFSEQLHGETFDRLLNAQNAKFHTDLLSRDNRIALFSSVFAVLRLLNRRGFWYPDLDFSNIFLVPHKTGYHTHLIDLDSAVAHDTPFCPDLVAQTFWEGLASTYRKMDIKFIKKEGSPFSVLVPHGEALNQSMLILLAYALQRLGKVPMNVSLYDPLVHPKNPNSAVVSQIHQDLADNKNCWDLVLECCSYLLKINTLDLKKNIRQKMAEPLQGRGKLGRWLDSIFRRPVA